MHCSEKCKRSLIIILGFCCQHAYSVPKLPQHNLRWKLSDQNFSYKSKKLGFEPIAQARVFFVFFLFPVTWQAGCLWVAHMDGLDLDIGTWWKGKTHLPPFVWPFKKISLLTIFSCASKSVSCLSLCLPEFLLTDLQATQAGLCGVLNHPSHSCFPLPLSHFPRTYVTCLQPTFSNDISPELFEWFNHNNSLRCIVLSPFHKWENWGPSPDSLSERGRPEFCLPNWKEILRTQLSHLYSSSLCYRGHCSAWCTGV